MEVNHSPGLDLKHGFLQYIQQRQLCRAAVSEQEKLSTAGGHLKKVSQAKKRYPDQLLYAIPGRRSTSEVNGRQTIPMDMEEVLTLRAAKNNQVLCTLFMKQVDLSRYVKEAQPYILQAIRDPASLQPADLAELAKVIVNRSWEDVTYYPTAATLCHYIVQRESQHHAERSAFYCGMVAACKELLKDWQLLRRRSVQCWLAFCHFLTQCFKEVRANSSDRALGELLLSCLSLLAQEPCVANFDEVELLSSIFQDCGRSLQKENSEKMEKLVCQFRDVFLAQSTDQFIRGMLLLPIELYASDWEISDNAKSFHFRM